MIIGAIGAISLLKKPGGDVDPGKIYSSSEILGLKGDKVYSSPIGLLPPFQQAQITSGEYSVEVPYMAKVKNTLVVDAQGGTYLKAINNLPKVNDFLEYLYTKNANPEDLEKLTAEDKSLMQAGEYIKFDFVTLLGYDSYYDTNNLFGGFFVHTQNSLDGKSEGLETMAVNTSTCQTAFEAAKSATSASTINTAALKPTYRQAGDKYVVDLNDAVIEDAHAKVITYLEECFDFNKPSMVEYDDYLARLKEREVEFPQISFKQNGSAWEMIISREEDQESATALVIQNLGTSEAPAGAVNAKALSDFNTRFGMAYDSCRLPPTVLSDFGGRDYNFIAESGSYYQPSNFDTGYVCVPSQAKGYEANDFLMGIELPQGGRIELQGEGITEFQVVYEMRYIAEQYFVAHGTYPDTEYVFSEVKKIDGLANIAKRLQDGGVVTYKQLPEGCSNKCTDFEMVRVVRDEAQDITINLTMYSYDHKSQ